MSRRIRPERAALLVLASAVAVAPLVGILEVGTLLWLCGCEMPVALGEVHPCVVLGIDIGQAVTSTAAAGFLLPMTLPVGGLLCLLLLVFPVGSR